MPLEKSLREYRTGFVVIDGLAICVAFFLAHGLRHGTLLHLPGPYLVALPYTVALFLVAFRYFGAYESRAGGLREVLSIVTGVAAGMAGLLALGFFYRGFSYSRLTAVYLGIFSVIIVVVARHSYRLALDTLFGRSQWLKHVLVVGEGEIVDRLLEVLLHHKSDYFPIGVVTAGGKPEAKTPHGVPVLGSIDDLEGVLEKHDPALIIIAEPDLPEEVQRKVLDSAVDRNIHWMQVPRVTAPPDQELQLTVLAGIPLLGSKSNNITGFNYFVKRSSDVIIALFLLLLFSPLMLAVAVLIKLFSKGPVLFVQERVGYRGKPFKFYKFRSMHVNNDPTIHQEYVKKWISGSEEAAVQDEDGVKVHKLTKDPRVIPYIGPFIRKFSIDELPQLFNVIKGDMSLVGPRPCLPYEVDMYKR